MHTWLARASATLVHEGHRSWAVHVTGLNAIESEARTLNQRANRAIEMAAAADTFPGRREAILPPSNARIGRAAMFYEQEPTTRLEHPTHFEE